MLARTSPLGTLEGPVIHVEWLRQPIDPMGVTLMEFTIRATPTDGLANQRESNHVRRSSLEAEWEARFEHKLQIARDFRVLNQISNSSDGFPHSNFPVFNRNEKIRRELNALKRNIEADQDAETWTKLGQI